MDKKAIIEGLKSVGRVVLFAAIGAAIAYVAELPKDSTTVIVLLILKFIDKYIHESPEINANGLAPF